jgi:sulfate adenylyltransferase (ADP) / ATP adenylyltransferase
MMFEQGTLWSRVVSTTQRAKASGALISIATNTVPVNDGSIRFFIRVVSGFHRKDEARKEQTASSNRGAKINPFLPPEPELTVADITSTHIAVLNKFNVVDHHLLIITRAFEHQNTLLTLRDFEALWLCMSEYNSLGFYNGGQEAGASQEHKHIQLVPLPLTPEGPPVAIEPLLPTIPASDFTTIPDLPFLHVFARLDQRALDSPEVAASQMFDLYAVMLASLDMTTPLPGHAVRQSGPYCFIATREWMLLVPRTQEFFENISLNSLAFVGSLFVRNEQQLERLKAVGPVRALASVTLPITDDR